MTPDPVTAPTTVLLVDDQPLLRAGFRMVLASHAGIVVVGEAGDGLEGVREAERLCPDVVLMDIRMPGVDGVEATRRIVEAGLPSRVLVLTTFDLDEYAFAALRAGASGFLLKDVPPDQLVAAIASVASGDAVVAPRVTRSLLSAFARDLPEAPQPGRDDAVGSLTEREREVLLLVARGLSNAEIAAELVVGETTVKSHVSKMLEKLGLRDRVQAVVLAYEAGLVVPGRDPQL